MAGQGQLLEQKAAGLMLHPNQFSLPEGALLEADNVVIDRPNVVSKVRGVNRYGDALSSTASTMDVFNDRIHFLDGSTLKYDSDGAGTFTSLSGTFAAPNSDHRMRFAQSLFSLYFTTSTGPFRLDSLGGTPARTGIPQGLDIETSFTGTGLGWFTSSQVGYKVVYIRKDANDQEIIGAPSFRLVVTNAKTSVTWTFAAGTVTVTHTAHGYSTGDTVQITDASTGDEAVETPTSTITVTGVDTYTYTIAGTPSASGTASAHRNEDVSLTTTIPDDIAAGDFLEVYRTALSADDTTDPGGEYLKVNRFELAAGDITAGTFTFTDDFDPAFLGLRLYTNPSQQGTGQANFRPPFALDAALFKGHLFLSNTRQPHRLELQFLETTGLVADTDTITIGGRTYTFASAESIPAQDFLLETSLATEANNVEETMRSLVRVANRDTGNTTFYLHYISGAQDPPGQILIERRDLTDTSLAATANVAATGDNFSPVLPTSGTTISTIATTFPNRLFRSKFEQPDAVPLGNFDDVGAARDEILRIVDLRDSLLIFTERGIYRLSGETERDFSIRLIETEVQLLAQESPAVLNDAAYAFTNQGVVRVTENGAEVLSYYGIERELFKIRNFTNFRTVTWGLADEGDRKYYLWTQGESGDTTAVHAWVWNDFTKTWTRRLKEAACGVVPRTDGVIFLGHAVDSVILKERKSFGVSNTDFVDEDIPVTITAVGTTTDSDGNTVSQLTLTYTYTGTALAVEFLIEQGTDFGRVTALTDNGGNSFTVDLDTLGSYTAAAATAALPIASRVRWSPEVAGDPSSQKMFTYATLSLEEDTAREINLGFVSDVTIPEGFVNPLVIALATGWGSMKWGSDPWGSGGPVRSTPLRVPIPQRFRRCRGLSTIVTHDRARSSFELVSLGLTTRVIGDRTTKEL